MYEERLPYLMKQYLDNLITPAEFEELLLHIKNEGSAAEVQTVLETLIGQSPGATDYKEDDWAPLFQKILQQAEVPVPEQASRKLRRLSRRWTVAAAVLLVLGTGFIWYKEQRGKVPVAAAPAASDLAPGSNKATLTLADGSTINLGTAQNGVLGQQGKMQLVKSGNERLVYQPGQGRGSEELQYNLLTTPRGGQYQLQLPDGSKVWLNAATSLRYPTSFTGGDRVVELKGEAYFEIKADATKPFRVKVWRGEFSETEPLQVEVLGTHFNIMDYDEEPTISTTLLEGLVRVRKGEHSVLVRPGRQAQLDKGEELRVTETDTEAAVAWKDGMFKFRDAGIEQVMRQLARWYDVEVVYVNGVPGDRFQGEMYRNVNASKILKVLEASGVHFTVTGRKINLFMGKSP